MNYIVLIIYSMLTRRVNYFQRYATFSRRENFHSLENVFPGRLRGAGRPRRAGRIVRLN